MREGAPAALGTESGPSTRLAGAWDIASNVTGQAPALLPATAMPIDSCNVEASMGASSEASIGASNVEASMGASSSAADASPDMASAGPPDTTVKQEKGSESAALETGGPNFMAAVADDGDGEQKADKPAEKKVPVRELFMVCLVFSALFLMFCVVCLCGTAIHGWCKLGSGGAEEETHGWCWLGTVTMGTVEETCFAREHARTYAHCVECVSSAPARVYPVQAL